MKHMRAHPPTSRERHGYSLVELMVVVVIIGVLATVAIPSFIGYLHKSKTSEAISFLAAIKQRQAAYYAEMGQYCDVSGTQDNWFPAGTPDSNQMTWASAPTEWLMLGASPDSPAVYFQYSSVAGLAGTTPADGGFSDDRGYTGTNFWFVSSARGDLNGDGEFVTFESYSGSADLYISKARGWD